MMPQGPPSICWRPYGVVGCGERINPWNQDFGRKEGPFWNTAFLRS